MAYFLRPARSLFIGLMGLGLVINGATASLALDRDHDPSNLDGYVGNWELFGAGEDNTLTYQGGVLMEESNRGLMGLVFLELGQGLVGMMELEPTETDTFSGRIWMFDLQLKPAQQKSIIIPVTAIASPQEEAFLELNLAADGVLLQEELKVVATLLTPQVEAQRQAQTNLYYVNLSQEVYFEEFKEFNQDIQSLAYLLAEDSAYTYTLKTIADEQVQAIATPNQDDLRTYIGEVFYGEDGTFTSMRCEAEKPGLIVQIPPSTFTNDEALCPAGFRKLL